MVLASTIDFTLPLADPVLKFLLILLIILAAPLLLNKLRIPHLLGLIIAGAIIGPHGFNLVLRDSSIILSGTAGLLYIMFLAGLEIDMADFKRNSTKSLAFGMYTFLIPMILGTVVGIWVPIQRIDLRFTRQYVRLPYIDRLSDYQQTGYQQKQSCQYHRRRNDDH